MLRLLTLLQSARTWTGEELAERQGVTTRTVRYDVQRLRELGYRVRATPGVAGGYRLDAGAALPPLVLDDEEAVAVAVGLRTCAGGSISGIEETSLRALLKLEQILPSRLRRRLRAMVDATTSVAFGGPTVDADVLTAMASAVRDREQLRFDYAAYDGTATQRRAEPHRLVHAQGRWYLAAWDVDREDWRSFRVDRVQLRTPNGPRFTPRVEPPEGLVARVETGIATAMWGYRTSVVVHAPAAYVVGRLPSGLAVEPVDEAACQVELGSDTPHDLALWLALLDADFTVAGETTLAEHLTTLSERFARAAATARTT